MLICTILITVLIINSSSAQAPSTSGKTMEDAKGIEEKPITRIAQVHWPVVTENTRPWTRWWWMGSAVDSGDLRANMEQYKVAGLGGLELTPIYGVKGYEDRFISYLSPRWMEMFSYTLKEARRLGLGLDMSTGTGWPFGGGPLIGGTYACKELFYKTWLLKDGESLKDTVSFIQEPLVRTDGYPKPDIDQLVEPVFANPKLQQLALFQVRFRKRLPLQTLMAYSADGRIMELTSKVDSAGRLQWVAPPGSGSWTLYAIFQGWHGKMVERAAPGGEGNVIDHFSDKALTKYLSRFDTAFAGHDLSGLRAFFNDSYEVDDANGQSNWTPGFFEAFREYRGYDLKEHLPALFGRDTRENNERIRCDYRETISDLLLRKFTLPWKKWAHDRGTIIRNQAHGSPANILDLYAASDIPETEGADMLRYKFATSAGHVSGKQLISSESVTWLNEHFLSTLSDIKKAMDKYLLGGVNHVFYHGTAYSPAGDPWPGWLFYAAVHFTPNDPSWQNFPVVNRYVARCQSFLQKGSPDNDILLYYPIYDKWSETGAALLKHFDGMDPEFTGTGFSECAERMQRQGYAFDYISDMQLQETSPEGDDILTAGGSRYRAILLPDCHYISVEALKKIIQLAENGLKIIVYKALPAGPPGYADWQERGNVTTRLLSRLHFKPTGTAGIQKAVIGKGAFIMGDNILPLLDYAGIRRESFVEDSLDFIRRKYGRGNVYFIVNHRSQKWEGDVALSVPFRSAAIFDPMTGSVGRADQHAGKVYLQLSPGESCLVQTFDTVISTPAFPYYRPVGEPSAMHGVWTVEFKEGGPKLPAPVKVSRLGSWTDLEEDGVRNFSGTAGYSISFSLPQMPGKPGAWLLDLGTVNETAQVFLNGNKIATLIGPPYQVIISAEQIRERDSNFLEISVSNLMANRIAEMDRQGIAWRKFYNTNFPAHDRANRGTNGLFDAAKWSPLPSGLSGPVMITPLEHAWTRN